MLPRSFSTELTADLQAIFKLMPGAYLVLSPQFRVELVSNGYQAAVSAGWPSLSVGDYLPAVLEGGTVGRCIARKLMTSLAQVLQTGQPQEVACPRTCQLPGQTLPGASTAWQLSSQPVRDATGVVCQLLCQITLGPAAPRLVVSDELPANESSLSTVLAQLPLALCILRGPRYLVEAFNPLAARLWRLPAKAIIGRPFLAFLSKASIADYAAACVEVWQKGQAVTWAEMPVAGFEQGTELTYFSVSFQALQPHWGEQGGLLLVAQNVTPLLQARQQAQQLQAELAATTAGLADYVAELLHASAGDGQPSPA